MVTIAVLSPYMSNKKTIAIGLGVFFILAALYLLIVNHYHLFQ
jgi:hypothetical protein